MSVKPAAGQKATLLTGDQDFKPLVDALVQEGMFVTLWYPPGETNSEIIRAADRRRPILLSQLADLLTPESRQRFALPHMRNFHPPEQAEPSDKRASWSLDDSRYALFRDGQDWLVIRSTSDPLNRLHIRHSNWDLLLLHMKEHNMQIPEEHHRIGAT
ncbi:NYN domain-containing protein [Phreatobacter stygius]|uniref:NYN domain-containing protein n=1 Tax=Phreatobacter stygius TaxID=1940610 RepID=A0A4D7AWW2_9HYPH|nr:NYN domain-containing protein [Phreatobacter stygius]QCI64531.1 NYN domain-containing protein [Phreatobacter stygius]